MNIKLVAQESEETEICPVCKDVRFYCKCWYDSQVADLMRSEPSRSELCQLV